MKSAALLAFWTAAAAMLAHAQSECDETAAKKNADWVKSAPHSWLSDTEHKQDVELSRTWCHIWETEGTDRLMKAIDFGRVLFTGDGLHPSVGSIVPGSGFAGGLVYNLERAAKKRPLRYTGSVEARGSYNGFWTAGAKLDIWGSAGSPEDRHIHAGLDFEHYELPQIAYYGLGNASSLASASFFGLSQSTGGGHIEIPLPGGFLVSGGMAGLENNPAPARGASAPSIEQVFTPANTPGLGVSTTYVVAGGGIGWMYPVSPRIKGFSTALTGGYRWFEATSGPYSFRRLDAIWQGRYTPETRFDFGALSLTARFAESYAPAGNSIPFYMQSTIGGTDLYNVDVLRSYRDYRFRAPNVLTFQTEYRRTIWGPFQALGFYDVGRVFEQRSDIEIGHMRHSFGAGLLVQVGALPVFKVYYAWGGSEGTHTTYTGNTNNFTFSTPGGVF